MNFPRLEITTQKSRIIIDKTPPKMNISGQVGDFTLEKEKRVFEIDKKSDKVIINNYPPKKELNFRRPEDLRLHIASVSKEEYSKGLSEIVENSDMLLKIENKNLNAIKEIAKKKAKFTTNTSLNMTFFPKEPIKIDVQKGHFDVNYSPEKISTYVHKKLNIEAEMGKIDIKVDKYPKVEIDVVGENLNYLI